MISTSIFRSPREYYRLKLKLPVIAFAYHTVELFKSKTRSGAEQVRTTIFRGTLVSVTVAALVWLSILMYVSFYYAYVPKVAYEKPVHLQFDTCEYESGLCSFPSAHVELTTRQQFLMLGQPYKMELVLEMPESPANKNLGMFMVCVDFRGKQRKLISRSCRSTMLHYRSSTLEFLYTVALSPFLMMGSLEEKQDVAVELYEDYEEIENNAVTDIYVEIQSRKVEIYSAKFLINAKFTGIRYIMFNWPVLSACIGITTNLFFIALIVMISWYQLIHSEEYLKYVNSKKQLEMFDNDLLNDDDSNSSSVEDASLLEKDVKRRGSVEDVSGQE
ncbi:seipin [Onthophagus taurus]|uniref:seipin n=1 Tax=Onthophagus taurus TaxID=166361 RepID=UPI000C207C4B|nr:seipin [Onthophagus taurus]